MVAVASHTDLLPQVMSLGAATKAISLPPAGTLVKFRGMVQDTGLGGELYPGSSADGTKLCMYGMEEGASDISVSPARESATTQMLTLRAPP